MRFTVLFLHADMEPSRKRKKRSGLSGSELVIAVNALASLMGKVRAEGPEEGDAGLAVNLETFLNLLREKLKDPHVWVS